MEELNKKMKEMLKNELEFCQEMEFVKNEHGQHIFVSQDGVQSMNLPFILNDYKDWLIEQKIVRERI